MKKNDGGLVIPINTFVNGDSDTPSVIPGLTVRDYFAAAALQGWIASLTGDEMYHTVRDEKLFDQHRKTVADIVYEYADAMLAERDK